MVVHLSLSLHLQVHYLPSNECTLSQVIPEQVKESALKIPFPHLPSAVAGLKQMMIPHVHFHVSPLM